jgi:hypothetical protein
MNNITSYAFLITSYALNKLTHWFKLSRDENSLLNTPKLAHDMLLKKLKLKPAHMRKTAHDCLP